MQTSRRLWTKWLIRVQIARVISALAAAGILEMRGVDGKPGWFWLFLLEGLLTFLIGFVVRVLLLIVEIIVANTIL